MDAHCSYGEFVWGDVEVWSSDSGFFGMGASFAGACHYAALRSDNRLPACVAKPRRTNFFYEDPPIADQDTVSWVQLDAVNADFYDGE